MKNPVGCRYRLALSLLVTTDASDFETTSSEHAVTAVRRWDQSGRERRDYGERLGEKVGLSREWKTPGDRL